MRKRHRPRWVRVIAKVLTIYLGREVNQHDIETVNDQGAQYAVRWNGPDGPLEFLVDLQPYNAGRDEAAVADEAVEEVEFAQWPPTRRDG